MDSYYAHLTHINRSRLKPHLPNNPCFNGPEFLAYRLQQWAHDHRVIWLFIQPGKPAQNAFIERLNRTFREDVLDAYLFSSLREVQEMAFEWTEMYNNFRPHEQFDPSKVCPANGFSCLLSTYYWYKLWALDTGRDFFKTQACLQTLS